MIAETVTPPPNEKRPKVRATKVSLPEFCVLHGICSALGATFKPTNSMSTTQPASTARASTTVWCLGHSYYSGLIDPIFRGAGGVD